MYLVVNYIPIYLENAVDFSIIFRLKVCMVRQCLKNGVGGKEIEFPFLKGNKLVKMHSDGKLIHLAINIY